jgi:hypothetical protein
MKIDIYNPVCETVTRKKISKLDEDCYLAQSVREGKSEEHKPVL